MWNDVPTFTVEVIDVFGEWTRPVGVEYLDLVLPDFGDCYLGHMSRIEFIVNDVECLGEGSTRMKFGLEVFEISVVHHTRYNDGDNNERCDYQHEDIRSIHKYKKLNMYLLIY